MAQLLVGAVLQYKLVTTCTVHVISVATTTWPRNTAAAADEAALYDSLSTATNDRLVQ